MIKLIGDNDVFEVIKLMNKSIKQNNYKYEKNEAKWILYFIESVKEQAKNNPHYIVIGDYVNNELKGFLIASSFTGHYNDTITMDVKDCIVDTDNQNAYTVIRLFNYMMDHIKRHGGKRWRADSIRAYEDTFKYAKLLKLKYNADLYYSAMGTIGD